MPIVDGTHVRISGIGAALARRVRYHHFRLLANVVVALAQRDRIPITLRHLPPVEAGDARRLGEHHVGFSQTAKSEELRLAFQLRKKVIKADLRRALANGLVEVASKQRQRDSSETRRIAYTHSTKNGCETRKNL